MLVELMDLRGRGFELGFVGSDLKVSCVKGGITPETRTYLLDRKQTIRAILERLGITSTVSIERCSYGQERLWLLDRIEPGGVGYHMALGLRLEGMLDEQALERALQTLVTRHEVLRTVYRADEAGQAVQVVMPQAQVKLSVQQAGEHAQPQQALQELVRQQLSKPFDLERDVMLRAQLVRLHDREHVLLVTLHHIAADGWSMQILAHELGQLYEAYAQGRDDPLGALPLQYKDYARWQRQWLQGELLQRQLQYWTQQLQGLPAVHALPLDRPRTAQARRSAGHVRRRLGMPLHRDMLALANANGATLFMLLHAAFAALLSRHSNERDIVIGTPVANREQAEVAPLVGFFVNTLVLRSDLKADPSFEQLLQQSKQRLLQAYEHQQLPFEKLVDALQPERSLGHTPLFQVMLVLQNNEAARPKLAGLQVRPLQIDSAQAKFDLTLDVQESEDGLRLDWEYAQELFDQASIERMAERLEVLLEAAVRAPRTAVSQLPLLSAGEREQLRRWNDTEAPYPHDACIHELIERQVARSPQRQALQFEDQQLSYAQLNAQANRLARWLQQQGVGPDVLVGVCMERSLEMVVALLGILKAGGAYVPLDPGLPDERIGYMLQDCNPPLLLTQRQLQQRLQPLGRPLLCLDDEAVQAQLQTLPGEDMPRGLNPGHLAYVIYTSGSTGRPKGVMNEHGAVVNRLHWMQQAFRLEPTDAVLQKTPYGFDVSVWEFFWPLMYGARLVIARPDGHKEPDYLAQLIDSAAVSTLHFVPSMLQAFMASCQNWKARSVRQVFCSGEALPPALRDRFVQLWPHVQLHNLYGPTEAAVDVTWYACSGDKARAIVPIGRPIANTHMHVLDEHLQPQPVGVVGELHIGGVQVARGYFGREELTAQRFIADPFDSRPGARLYKTGDLGRWLPDGNIEYLGRNDFQVKIRGLRIELGEIEAVLREYSGISDAAVVARDEPLRLVAYVCGSDGSTVEHGLREHLKQRLPDYMVPATFVFLPTLPLSPNGKLDRNALPMPGRPAVRLVNPPQGAIETEVAEIWCRLLQLDRVGRDQPFFELGGHSLLALKMLEEVNRRFAVSIPALELFRHQSIAAMAGVIESRRTRQHRESSITHYRTGDSHWTPLMVVHPIGGSSLCYAELLQHLRYRGPIWTIQQTPKVLAAETTGTVEGLASLYVDDAQAAAGPQAVCLLGWSFGGVVAYEMAREFERRGIAVRWLGLIDSQVHWPEQQLTVEDEALWVLARNIGIGNEDIGRLRSDHPITVEVALDLLLTQLHERRLLPETITTAELTQWHATTAANLARMRRYRATPWAGHASYYQALDGIARREDHPVWQWASLLSGMDMFPLNANHFTIVKGRQSELLARLMQRVLTEKGRK